MAVETAQGYFVAAYPDTEAGVTQFLGEIRTVLATEKDRFYSCVAYAGPGRDILQSPLAERIGVVTKFRTGLMDPGVGDTPWIVRSDHIDAYFAKHPRGKLDGKLVEKICLSLLPRNYMQLYPARPSVSEFYE